ncbi:MAG: hypothetical protein ACE5FQ_13770 [Thiogranum sp.]
MATTIVNFAVFMKVQDFFNENPVFRHEAFVAFLESTGSRRTKTREALLAYLTRNARRPFVFRGQEFLAVPFPRVLSAQQAELFGVTIQRHAGGNVRVTSLERTLVDVLVRPDLGGGWEEAG